MVILMSDSKRQFIRHPTDIPIEFSVRDETEKINVKDIGVGGLCFASKHSINTGQQLHILIPVCNPEFDASGVVCWCKQDGSNYLIGVSFQQEEVTFAVRMVEQICHIEDYRSQVKSEQGIELSSEQAAMQWISKYADKFPQIYT